MSNLLCSMRMRLDIHPFQEMGQRQIQAVQPIGGLIALMTVPVKHPTRGQNHVASIHRHLDAIHDRSEEHTSELQPLMRISYAVLCLKKKNNNVTTHD